MRRRVLLRSIDKHLPGGGPATAGAVLFSASGRGLLAAFVGGVATFAAVTLAGLVEATAVLAGFGVLLMVAAMTTDARVVADVGGRLAFLRGSRIRQAAVGFVEWIDEAPGYIEKTGSSFVSSQWRIGDRIYTATKRADKSLEEMLTGRLP